MIDLIVFPSTSRDTIRFSTDISYLMCFRAVAKFLYEKGSFTIMHPAINLSAKCTLQEFEFLDKNLYLMSLLCSRTVVHHPEVMKALHGIQFIARISCIILSNRCIP